MSRLTDKRTLLTIAFLAAVALLGLTTRVWVEGVISETITGTTKASIKGSKAAPVALAGALVALAAVIALMTSRRVGRIIASVALMLAGLMGAIGALNAALDPGSVVSAFLSGQAGHASATVDESSVLFWTWLAVAVSVLLCVLGALALVAGRRWSGLGEKYDAPTAPKESDWDQLSAGHDPTAAKPTED